MTGLRDIVVTTRRKQNPLVGTLCSPSWQPLESHVTECIGRKENRQIALYGGDVGLRPAQDKMTWTICAWRVATSVTSSWKPKQSWWSWWTNNFWQKSIWKKSFFFRKTLVVYYKYKKYEWFLWSETCDSWRIAIFIQYSASLIFNLCYHFCTKGWLEYVSFVISAFRNEYQRSWMIIEEIVITALCTVVLNSLPSLSFCWQIFLNSFFARLWLPYTLGGPKI